MREDMASYVQILKIGHGERFFGDVLLAGLSL